MTDWGSYVHVGNGVDIRVGIDASVSYPGGALDKSDTVATVSGSVYVQSKDGHAWDNGDWSVTGDIPTTTGSKYWDTSTASDDTVLLGTFSEQVSLIYGSSQTIDLTASLNNAALPDPPSRSTSVTVGARPYQLPATPTNFDAVYQHDGRFNLSWDQSTSSAAPVSSYELRRRPLGGSFGTIANPSGSARSYADTSTGGNDSYQWALRAKNSSGSSDWVYSGWKDTTPATPGKPSAAKNTAGDIVVTRPALSDVATTWEVEESGGATLATGIPASQSTWTHLSPSATKTWSYVIRAVSDDPVLYSDYSAASDPVQLLTPPNAPTVDGSAVIDGTEPWTLGWLHNPVDTTAQGAYEARWSTDSGATWTTTGQVTSTTSEHTFPADTWTNPASVEVQVRTWGQHPDPSAWSSSVVVDVNARPVAGVTAPSGVHDSDRVTAQWSYLDAEGTAQSQWRVTLRDSTGDVVEMKSGAGPATEVDLDHRVPDGTSWTLEVIVWDGSGLASLTASETFTVDWAQPPVPSGTASWDADTGLVTIIVDAPGFTAPEIEVDHLQVWRVTDAGLVLVADQLDRGMSAVDTIAPTGTTVTYRVAAVSALPSTTWSPDVTVETPTPWVFINYGTGFDQLVRVRGDLSVGRQAGRAKTHHRLARRQYEVERAGVHRTRTYELTGRTPAPHVPNGDWGQATWDDLEQLADALAPICVRDPDGTRIFCSVGQPRMDIGDPMRPFSIPFRMVGWAERVE